jgi:AraC-like DNA-binding protein
MSHALRIAHGAFGRVALLNMDAPLVRHAHPHCHVLIKASGADAHFVVGGTCCPLTDETAVLVNGWEPHAYVHDPLRPQTIILALYIEPQWLAALRPNWAASGAPGFFTAKVGALGPGLRRLADALRESMIDEPTGSETRDRLVEDLMTAVIERFAAWRSSRLDEFDGNRRVDWRVRKAIRMIRLDPRCADDIAGLAGAAGLSRAHFFRLFQHTLDVTPRVFINALRMETAVRSVMTSSRPLAELSSSLGFPAPPHFTRFFRDHAGAPPRQFRDTARLQSG